MSENKIIRKSNQHYDAWLHWNVTSKCNLNCEYCFGHTSSSTADIKQIDTEKLIAALNKTGKTYRISFTGGEPFLIPNIIDACNELTKKHFVSFNTNLVLPNHKIFAERINPGRVLHIHASVHFDELLDKKLLKLFTDHFHLFRKKGFNIYAEAVAYPGIKNRVEYYNNSLKKFGIEVSYSPYFGKFENNNYPESYSKEDIELFELNELELSWYKQKGEMCNAGYNAGVVFSGGSISPCFQIKERIGNIYGKINFNNSLVVCPSKRCGCPLNKYDDYLFKKGRSKL